jgi:hypothetical protein
MTMYPHSDDELAAQRGGEIVRAAALSVSAPPALREALERQRAAAGRTPRRGRWLVGAFAGATMVVVALAVLLTALSGTSAGPTVVQAATLGMQPATGPAPARDISAPDFVAAREGSVRFPYWSDEVPWKASGVRTDTLNGHHATTVFYRAPNGAQLAYTVVAVPALRIPAGQHQGRFVLLHRDGQTVVTWREQGQTCVITASSSQVPDSRLIYLARHDEDA